MFRGTKFSLRAHSRLFPVPGCWPRCPSCSWGEWGEHAHFSYPNWVTCSAGFTVAKARASGDHGWGASGLWKVSVQHQSLAVISGLLMFPRSLSITHWHQSFPFHAAQVMISEGKLVISFFVSVFKILYRRSKKTPIPNIKQKSSQRFLKVPLNIPPQNTSFLRSGSQ